MSLVAPAPFSAGSTKRNGSHIPIADDTMVLRRAQVRPPSSEAESPRVYSAHPFPSGGCCSRLRVEADAAAPVTVQFEWKLRRI